MEPPISREFVIWHLREANRILGTDGTEHDNRGVR